MSNQRGYQWHRDECAFYTRGYKKHYDTYNDGTKLFIQIRDAEAYFTVLKRNVENHFAIEHSDKALEKNLNDYFVRNLYRMNRGNLYGGAYGLVDFFANAYQQTAMIGESYYFIDWKSKEINGKKYRIPDGFDFIHPETMYYKRDTNGVVATYMQKYSLYARLKNPRYEEQMKKISYKSWQIFHTNWPFGNPHPVKKSYKLIKHFSWFLKYMLWSGEAGAYSKPRTLAVERARQRKFSDEKRKQDLLTAESYYNFHTPLAVNDLSITKYYDYFYYARFKADIYLARKYFVEQFNEQVLVPFAKKNNLAEAPKLKCFGLITDTESMEYFEKWKAGTINNEEFLDKVVKAD